jgi:hypothetical protein
MKRSIITLVIMAMASIAQAGPFLVSDPSSDNATSCVFESFQFPCMMDASKSIHVDLATLPVGSHSVRAQFCNGVWCSAWSAQFPFVRPALSVPGAIKLSK